ncbi:ABC transporter ATP-binding protein [Rhodococcus sp. MS16]|uniref:ABC transporter ATP-binding protein n=1 Tax=Rhodococcus sp. MS16 TaxID=2579941 RepID=UPI00156223C3|nr:ABC transporter ATP-binding protein [Rhodococcus sp. MS16]NRI65440.1 ABC transporter ATP-binding protein [Rhodococcus sp. MS16]
MTQVLPPLLRVENLSVQYTKPTGTTYVLEDVSLTVRAGESLGIVGESGSGKSVLARMILGVESARAAASVQGAIYFDNRELTGLAARERAGLAGVDIAMIFQDPMTSLNPVVRVRRQLMESVSNRQRLSRKAEREGAVELLRAVGVPDPERRVDAYPAEFSGGMRQRVGIAAAIAGKPRLLLADEPTTALDVTIQRKVLDLLDGLRRDLGMSMLLVTHDLGLLTGRAERTAVLYAGRMMETGPTVSVTTTPAHPYTRGLLDSIPRVSGPWRRELPTIAGSLPSMAAPRVGCPFAPRCPIALPRCSNERPPMTTVAFGHEAACWNLGEKGTS